MHRLLHAFLVRNASANLSATIVFTVRDDRPAVVFSGFGSIDFIAALRTVLIHPESAVWCQCRTLWAAVAIAPDLGQRIAAAHKGVVFGHAAVFGNAHNFAQVVLQVLRLLFVVRALAQRQKQTAIRPLHNAAAKMQLTGFLGFLAEEHLQVFQLALIAGESGFGQCRAVAGVVAGL